jgi:peroxiredoxin
MRFPIFISILFLALFSGAMAFADVPFNIDKFHASQEMGEKILLHFYADWCPTCKAQKKVLAQLEPSGVFNKITVYTVDYDKETEFKKEMKVTAQSTFITFFGKVEVERSSGVTDLEKIKTLITSLSKMTLTDQLALMQKQSSEKVPPEAAKTMKDATDKLRAEQLAEKALKKGQKMPDFSLPDAKGKTVTLKGLLKNGPVIVTFYRGSWCPYCNAQLSNYQQHLDEFKAKGATLVAVTPEKPDLTALLEEKKKLEFPILTDKNNVLAKKFGLVFALTPELKQLYMKFGIDLEKSQGNADWRLPIPATYVVGKNGKIIYAHVDPDYTKRADPEEILAALK